ncbi:MAG: hypothetical protein H6Q52_2864 [Deltaproteobacteria bacterium]|nr:hypothetical protein [Deltaproteobacteria bacterium]
MCNAKDQRRTEPETSSGRATLKQSGESGGATNAILAGKTEPSVVSEQPVLIDD